jgi:hypothetical protein
MAALQIADTFGLPAVHAEKVGGALHVDIEEGAPHQEIGRFGGDVLGELRQPLRRDDPGEAALPALMVVMAGLIPVILMNRMLRRAG